MRLKKIELPEALSDEVLMRIIKMQGDIIVAETYRNNIWTLNVRKMAFSMCHNMAFVESDKNHVESCDWIECLRIGNISAYNYERNIMLCKDEDKYELLPPIGFRLLSDAF